ncbi:MAG: glycosyl hydrolase family 2 [Candidatus Homeothermus sp.]|nr:glycosyl hydrolase family 2 [Candidatus Homeothermus sp.]
MRGKTPDLPPSKPEARAGTRWWWPGSAVDAENISWNLDRFSACGIGTVEITPIYGVQGNEAHDIEYLSPQWMKMLAHTVKEGKERNIRVDMNNGTGWPFGGPEVPIEEAACKAIFRDTIIYGDDIDLSEITFSLPEKDRKYARLQYTGVYPCGEARRVIALYTAPTLQKVKRAAPGGEGLVIDHFSRDAVKHYLERFDKAFAGSSTPFPATFFNDSYEVYGANWTPRLLEEFAGRRGYRLEEKLPELLGYVDDGNRTLADYRETLGELLYENFTCQWHDWANKHGVKVRNQAHGSPANLLDIYAAVDIPEIEGFGLSDFNIKGLRTDPGFTRKNDSDVSMLKYASSAAHVMGNPLTSSETFTWLTEHFRTSLSQMKPDLDLMFTCGVNHVFFHGSCYYPQDAQWPGWRFYASVDMTPNNPIWRDTPALMDYIERSQSFLQYGKPDNDFLVYLPVRDMWHNRLKEGEKGLLMQFDIHSMSKKAPGFIKSILTIDSLGYDCDYISDRQLANVRTEGARIVTEGGTSYRGIIIPTGTTLTSELKKLLAPLGNLVIYGEDEKNLAVHAPYEPMKRDNRLRAIRRKNLTGNHYFIANLTGNDVHEWIAPAVKYKDAVWFNPMNGDITPATIRDGKILFDLRSGESRILRTYTMELGLQQSVPDITDKKIIDLTPNKWKLTFVDETPAVGKVHNLCGLSTWESLGDTESITMGTGVYTTKVKLDNNDSRRSWEIDLGDVRESARVYINGEFIGCAWAAPFILDCGNSLHKGTNEIRIEVTNLPANRIAALDRDKTRWRIMKEINVVDINYKKTRYDNWQPMPSGLNSTVKLISGNI